MSEMLTDCQKDVLVRATRATLGDSWYRAETSGERVTLASLYRKGLVERRARRGFEGAADAAYEYQTASVVLEEFRKRVVNG